MSHTQGKLIAQIYESGAFDLEIDGARTFGVRLVIAWRKEIPTKEKEMHANGRRLAACWNACDGISTESLENAAADGRFIKIFSGLVKERDELLAVLKKCAVHIAANRGNSDEYAVMAFAAIARAEKGGV